MAAIFGIGLGDQVGGDEGGDNETGGNGTGGLNETGNETDQEDEGVPEIEDESSGVHHVAVVGIGAIGAISGTLIPILGGVMLALLGIGIDFQIGEGRSISTRGLVEQMEEETHPIMAILVLFSAIGLAVVCIVAIVLLVVLITPV